MSAGLPPDWVCLVSKSRKGKKYFYNAQTGISTWTRPKHQVSSESVGDHSTSYGHTNNRKRKNRTNSAEISSIQPKKKIYASSDSTTAIALEVLQKKAHQYRRSSTAGSVSAECNGSSLSEGNHTYDKNALSGIQDRSDEKGLAFAKAAAHESVEVACSKVTTHNRSCPSKKNENGKKAETDHSKLFFPSKNIESNTVNVKNYEITSKCQTNGSLESVTKSKGFKPKMSTVQFAPEKLQPLPNSHVISADKSSGYITTITGGANQKVKAKKKSRKKRQESTRSDNAVKNTSTALEIAFGLQPLVETSVKSESQKLSPDLHKKIYLDNGHFKNSYNLFSSSQTAYSASESLGNPQGDKKLPQQLSELEVPVLTEQKRSTESGAVSQKMKSIKTILCFSHNVSMTSNTPVAHWASVSKETLKTAPSTEYTTRKDELAKEHYFDVGLISEDLIKSCIQKNKLSETSTQNMYARTKSPQCQSMENCQKIIPNQGLVKCAEEDSAFAINKYNIKQIDSESIKMNQASLDDTRAKKTPMNTTRQTNSFDTNHIPATVIKRDSTGSHLGTNMTSFTTPESYGVNCPSILLDNATLIPKFSTADKFQGFNASNCQLARNADSPTNIPYSFQDADLDIYTSIDLGASLTDAARVIEDMDVDSDGTDATIQALMLVIDTNVLIDSLGFLAKLINTSVPGYGTPTFVLPWVVIQELDYLKVARKTLNTSRVQHDAVKAVRFIHTHLMAKNAHVKGQTPQEANEKTDLPIEMNDDKILHCCLQYQKKFPSSQLCLMTRDINLRNKAVIMGIDATNDNDLWSYLDNSSTVRKTGNVNLTNPLRETVSANMFVKEGTIPDEFIEKRNTSSTEKLNKQRRNERNRGVAEAITKILTGFPSSSNSGSKADSEVIRQQQVHTTEEASTVFSKFESVWKFVFNIKNQLNQILSSGKAEDEFDEAVKTLKTMSFLVSDLCCIYNSCLTVSPVILHNHPSQFEKLCSALNSFVTLSGVVNTDLNSPVRLDPMMAYFKETKNRILLMSGLEQMKNFSSEFLDMMNTLTSTRHVV